MSRNTAAESETDKKSAMTSFLEAAGQSSAPKTVQRNQALPEPNTSVLVDLCSFKEAQVTVSWDGVTPLPGAERVRHSRKHDEDAGLHNIWRKH